MVCVPASMITALLIDHTNFHMNNDSLGRMIYEWFISQCTDCRSKLEYNRSHIDLTSFLGCGDTKDAIGTKCIQAVIELQMSLKSKESKLAGYIRKDIKCSMDAPTTSPSESQNNFTKHFESHINSTMNISKSLPTLLNKNDRRIKLNNDKAVRELASHNLVSCAPTKNYLNKKGQGLADHYFDRSINYKSARVGPNKFLVWNFDLVKEPE